jgi:hypothetical protein
VIGELIKQPDDGTQFRFRQGGGPLALAAVVAMEEAMVFNQGFD